MPDLAAGRSRTPFSGMTSASAAPVPPIATIDAALVAIAERRRALKAARSRFTETPDADALHDLRVAIRRLRAALDLFAPAVKLPRRSGERRLRKLGRSLTGLRDADVLRAALTGDEAAAAGVGAELVERVEARRRDALEAAERTLRRRRTRRLLRGFARWERRPRFAVGPDEVIATTLPPRLRARAEYFAALPAWGLKLRRDADGRLEDAEGGLDREALHETLHWLRRQAKKLRYELEIAGPLLGLDESAAVGYLREIQDALGELQDVRVVEAALDRLPDAERPGDRYRTWLKERRYRAVEQWRRLRRQRGSPVLSLVKDAALPPAR